MLAHFNISNLMTLYLYGRFFTLRMEHQAPLEQARPLRLYRWSDCLHQIHLVQACSFSLAIRHTAAVQGHTALQHGPFSITSHARLGAQPALRPVPLLYTSGTTLWGQGLSHPSAGMEDAPFRPVKMSRSARHPCLRVRMRKPGQ